MENDVNATPAAFANDAATRVQMQNAMSDAYVPDIPWLPPSPQKPEDWFAWRDAVIAHRVQVILETTHGTGIPHDEVEAARDREAQRCRESRPYMIATYGSIYEARPEEEDMGSEDEPPPGVMIPFIPYPFQIRVMFNYYRRRSTRGRLGDGLDVKARDMGLSNTYCFLVAGDWACEPVFQARMASRTEDLVDATGDPDSLFWKIEMFLAGLPTWLLQRLVPGFDWKRHRQNAKFINPATKNTIQGESTQANMGRGGRATVIIYDEAAFMPNFGKIWTAGRASTRHRIAISTVSVDEGLDFYNLHKGLQGYESPDVQQIHWYEHPLHDDAWLEAERERDTEEGIQREVFMNYHAGTGEWVYPETHDRQAGHFPYIPGGGPVFVTMDDGFDDDFAIIWLQFVRETGRFRVFQSYQNRHMVTDFYGSLLKGVPEGQFGPWYGKQERLIMLRQQEMVPPVYTIDSHFDNVEQMTGSSPFERFADKYGIVAHMSFDPNKRQFKTRRNKLGQMLPMIDFHEHDGGQDVLDALQRHRLKSFSAGKDQQSEQKKPLHSRESHMVSAMEWLAVNWDEISFLTNDVEFVYTGSPNGSSPNPSGTGYNARQ